MTALIEAKGLTKWYGDVVALNDLTLDVPKGLTGLLGPNGSGKTTMLHLGLGLLKPSKGSVRVLDEDPWQNPRLYKRVGFVPETLALWEWMKGVDHVAFSANLAGLRGSNARERAREVLDQVGLKDASGRRVGGYSRGMRQRIKIAMAILHEPELLLLDEPFNGLDPVGRRQMSELVRELAGAGTSVLFSSHVLHEVEALTRTVVVIHAGHVVASGDVHELRSLMDRHPHHVRVVVDRPRELARLLAGMEDVVRVRVDEKKLEVEAETQRPDRFYGDLQNLLLDHRFDVSELTSPDDNLQAVFRYLTERAAGGSP